MPFELPRATIVAPRPTVASVSLTMAVAPSDAPPAPFDETETLPPNDSVWASSLASTPTLPPAVTTAFDPTDASVVATSVWRPSAPAMAMPLPETLPAAVTDSTNSSRCGIGSRIARTKSRATPPASSARRVPPVDGPHPFGLPPGPGRCRRGPSGRRHPPGDRKPALDAGDRLLLALVYYRVYVPFAVLGFLFGVDASTACRTVRRGRTPARWRLPPPGTQGRDRRRRTEGGAFFKAPERPTDRRTRGERGFTPARRSVTPSRSKSSCPRR